MQKIKLFFHRLAQTARLMVGVPDYAQYVEHMQTAHPNHPIMSEADFHRRAVDVRYPGKSGNIKKCPC